MTNNARFFVNDVLLCDSKIVLLESVIRHFFALRIKQGDQVTLFNGDGFDYHCTVLTTSKKAIELSVDYSTTNSYVLPIEINLMMSLIQRENFELVLQKSVEIGVNKITPIYSDFSQRIDKSKIDDRLLRWEQIIISASEQSGRNIIPTIDYPLHITEIVDSIHKLNEIEKVCNIVCDIKGDDNLLNLSLCDYDFINLLVGPEGGFSIEELEGFKDSFWKYRINLGKNILRAETASIVSLGFLAQKIQYKEVI
jgi:16S rRNA (uracil1498-N3)-methyltransferase